MPARTFNADEKTQELLESEVTIGGHKFKPALVTPDVRKAQSAIQIDNFKLIRREGLEKSATEVTEAQLDRRLGSVTELDDSVYKQLTILLRDEHDKPPAEKFVRDHLDFRVARDLLSWLGEEDEGESQETTTPQASGA